MSTLVYVDFLENDNGVIYNVRCPRCCGEIGTMTPDTLKAAVMATKDRGGVLCPDCREISCKTCGGLTREKDREAPGWEGLCAVCEFVAMLV